MWEIEFPQLYPHASQAGIGEAQTAPGVDSLTAIGRSHALTDRLAALEHRRYELKTQLDSKPAKLLAVPDATKRFKELIAKIEELPRHQRMDEALAHRARVGLHEYLGPIPAAEEGDGVYAYVEMGRAVLVHGAQDSLTELKPILVA